MLLLQRLALLVNSEPITSVFYFLESSATYTNYEYRYKPYKATDTSYSSNSGKKDKTSISVISSLNVGTCYKFEVWIWCENEEQTASRFSSDYCTSEYIWYRYLKKKSSEKKIE